MCMSKLMDDRAESSSGASESDIFDTEDELQTENESTPALLSDCLDPEMRNSDSELDLYNCSDPKHWEDLKPELQCALSESNEFSYLVKSYHALPQDKFVVPHCPILRNMSRLTLMMELESRIGLIADRTRHCVHPEFLVLTSQPSNV